jgi:hypothetical protein
MHLRASPLVKTLLFLILLLHLLFLLVLFISPAFVFQKKQHRPLLVKTIVPKLSSKTTPLKKAALGQKSATTAPPSANPPSTSKQQITKTQAQPPKNPVSKPAPSVKKEPAIADKHLSKTKQPTAKKNPPLHTKAKISDSLLKDLEESIAKIENKSDKEHSKNRSFSSKALAPIALQMETSSHELVSNDGDTGDYIDVLVSHLHHCLTLPDYGEVKIQLNLRQDGTVCKVIVVKAQSEKNKQYLENNLPHLKFPHFEGAYANKKEYTFVLTFCNES